MENYTHPYFAFPQEVASECAMDIEQTLRAIMRLKDWNQGEVASALGVSQPTVHRWLKGSEPEGHRRDAILALYKAALGNRDEPIAVVRIMGSVGAGSVIMPDYEQLPPEGLGEVELQIPLPGDMMAFRVDGVSMMPQYRAGAIIVVWKDQRRPIEAFYGHEAAVRTEDGRRYIKTITKSDKQGRVTLTSWNAEPIEDVRLEWIGEIYVVLPPTLGARF